ncbi:MAG TPA: transglutaminase family protein [Chthoniobacteraceae bacterium]|nr:transglutaminase family protein [Chthoniobacteraceae bacterium]
MNRPDPPLDITIRCGLDFIYQAAAPTPIVLLIKPRLDRWQHIEKEQFSFEPHMPLEEHEDEHGNLVHRLVLPAGQTRVRHDAFVAVPSVPENHGAIDEPMPIAEIPLRLLRYVLPSRYCDSDKLLDFAFQHFGTVPHGLQRVQAICDWVHNNIEYRFGSGSPLKSAADTIADGFGVCRDFAHTAAALCRTFNIPTRYVTGYVPDVAFQDPGTLMDFHAYFEVFIGGRWQTFDARFNVPRIGRIKIACGLDAVDGAFSTLYGAGQLAKFDVWAYQVDPAEVDLGDPIDLSKRLCGTTELRFPPRVKAA